MSIETITRQVCRDVSYETGWGVACLIIWDDEDRVSDVEIVVVEIAPATEKVLGGVLCVSIGPDMNIPIQNFEHVEDLATDDTHDLRDRWFATEDEAREHARYTVDRWANPEPWCSFVKI